MEPDLKFFHVQIKCSRTHPCTSCMAANVRCEFREDDFKRPPVSREYIAALESRVATLEAVIGRLKEASSEERDEILEGVTLQEQTQPFAPETEADPDVDEIALSDAIRKATLHETDQGMLPTHVAFITETMPNAKRTKVHLRIMAQPAYSTAASSSHQAPLLRRLSRRPSGIASTPYTPRPFGSASGSSSGGNIHTSRSSTENISCRCSRMGIPPALNLDSPLSCTPCVQSAH